MRRTVIPSIVVAVAAMACAPAESAPAAVTEPFASPAGPGSGQPYLTSDARGRVYMTWLEPSAGGTALRFAVLDGERWSAPQTIAASRAMLANWADFPTLLVAGDGRLAAHWMERTPGNSHAYDLYLARSADDGKTWTRPVKPHRDSLPAEHGFAALYATGAEAVGAAWLDGRKHAARDAAGGGASAPVGEMMLAHATMGRDGTVGPESVLDPRICDCCQTSLAMAASGPVLVYRDRSPDEIRDISIVRNVRGTWTAPRPVHADNWRVTFCPVNGPSVAARGDQVAVAWFTASPDTSVLVAFSADGGATFGEPVRVDEGAPLGRVDVELDARGAMVTWIERGAPGRDAAVRLRRVSPERVAGAPITLGEISPARPSGFPRVVARGTELFAAWTTVGRPSSVQMARVRTDRLR